MYSRELLDSTDLLLLPVTMWNINKSIYIKKKKQDVLVHFGLQDKVPQTGWHLNDRCVLLTVPEAGSLRSGC